MVMIDRLEAAGFNIARRDGDVLVFVNGPQHHSR
jgi:hypothetical protein